MDLQQFALKPSAELQPSAPNKPATNVVVGAEPDAAIGVVQVTIPANGAMAEHDHGASHTLLIPQRGGAPRLVHGGDGNGRIVELTPGTVTLIPVGERVRVENPSDEHAELLVVLTPPDFARRLAGRG